MKTIISHFYNEEYLLPWWLNHHKKFFDTGIMIDYNSTDNSVDIIKQICPEWKIVKSKNEFFDSDLINREVEDYEKSINGWKICLNTTEFIIGKFNILKDSNENIDILIPPYIMVDNKENQFKYPDSKLDLIEQRTYGSSYKNLDVFNFKMARKMSNYFSVYPTGRHYNHYTTDKFAILWYGFSPMNHLLLKRKIQIQNRISQNDKNLGRGFHHITTEQEQIKNFYHWQERSMELKNEIQSLMM